MAEIFPMNLEVSMDLKWEAVKIHYESTYKDKHGKPIRFKERLSDKDIQVLWMKLNQLQAEKHNWFSQKPGLRRKFMEKAGLLLSDSNENNTD